MTEERVKYDEYGQIYPAALQIFLSALDRADHDGRFDQADEFARLLKFSFSNYGLSAADLSREERISKASISKWLNGHAVPPAPTRKTVINWIKSAIESRLKVIEESYPERNKTAKKDIRALSFAI